VPPVAIKSSIIKTLAFSFGKASRCISNSSNPYSNSYFSQIVAPGSLPFFLAGTNPIFNLSSRVAPNIKPLASSQTI